MIWKRLCLAAALASGLASAQDPKPQGREAHAAQPQGCQEQAAQPQSREEEAPRPESAAQDGQRQGHGEQDAMYEGHSVREWVDRLAAGEEQAEATVLALGAPCVPLLLERLVGQNTPDGSERLWWALEKMGDRADPALVAQVAQRGPAEVRLLALHFALHDSPPDELMDLVPALLRDEDKELRIGVAVELCGWGFDRAEALPPLLEGLQSKAFRARAAGLLWVFSQEHALVVPPLIGATRDPDPDVRYAAFGSLSVFWPTSKDARIRILEASDSQDPSERLGSVVAAPRTQDGVALCLKAADDADEKVRETAIETLQALLGWQHVLLGDSAEHALSHRSAEIRKLACEAVGDGETPLLAHVLALLDDESEDVRREALDAIGRIGDSGPEVRGKLRALLAGESFATAVRAAWILIRMNADVDEAATLLADACHSIEVAAALGPRASVVVPSLREMIEGAEPSEAAWALHVVTGELDAPLDALRGELSGEDAAGACIVVQRFGPAAADLAPLLTKLLDTSARCEAATALGYLGAVAAKPAIPKLVRLIEAEGAAGADEDRCAHAAAALAWLDIESPRMEPILKHVLDEWDEDECETRAGALRYFWKHERMPVEEVVERCRNSLYPCNWYDVLPILRLLGEIGPAAAPAIPDLEDLKDSRYEIRTAAADALRRIRAR